MDTLDDSYSPKFTRSRTGCLRCKKGKHKCDEERPVCRRCRNVTKECVYPPTPTPKSTARSGKKRRLLSTNSERFEELVEGRNNEENSASGTRPLSPLELDESIPLFFTPSDHLALSFPDAQERDLMRHLLYFGNVVLYSIPVQNEPIQFLHLAQCFQHSRGFSLESDTLLLSLISIAASHKSSLSMQQEKKYLTSYPASRWDLISLGNDPTSWSPPNVSQSAQRELGNHFSRTSLSLCDTTVSFRQGGNGLTDDTSNLLITSSLAVIIAQCLNAGTLWKQAFDKALNLINLRGGPAQMLQKAQEISPLEVTRVRMLLENLVIVDVCQCLASSAPPSLMKEPFAPWWFDYVSAGTDTVHNAYGVDRGVIELVNRVNMLVHESTGLFTILDNKGYLDMHKSKVDDLLLEIEVWEVDVYKEATGLPRVTFGNRVLIQTLKVVIHVDLLGKSHSDPIVQTSALAAINAFSQARASDHGVGLLMAAIITGSMMLDEPSRAEARRIVTDMRTTPVFAFDVEVAITMLEKLYQLRDQGAIDPSWRLVTVSDMLLF
ncbi:uncharacterized protein IL334_005782 [Kwoniella shivajii]|uniref:Zn(2)-C6 fungal-type domain-containing protein n=1 Tax=Kwoniella shivajii TaxID=564305 RepID=A0ABZ1D824_9TREE|nr:hypothetical protein IL334_005782 [Kwoniella shivajii]